MHPGEQLTPIDATAPQRQWLPAGYIDEIVPPLRDTPTAWVERLPGENVYAMAYAEEDLADEHEPWILRDGESVEFHWRVDLGGTWLTVHDDGSWSCPDPEPVAPAGSSLCCIGEDDTDTLSNSLEELAKNFSRGDWKVRFYAWSDRPERFVFRDGEFYPIESAAAQT